MRVGNAYKPRDEREGGNFMSSTSLMRLGGLAAMLGGGLIFITDILGLLILDFEDFSATAASGSWILWSALYLLGLVLILGGLVGLYVYQAEAAGILGLVGFLVAFLGTALVVGAFWDNLFIVPSLAIEAPEFLDAETVAGPANFGFILTNVLVFGGWALFGLATLRAGVFPRIAAIVTIAGALIAFVPLPAITVVLDVGVAWLGFALLTERSSQSEQASRVR
jgi:hypothetical protein